MSTKRHAWQTSGDLTHSLALPFGPQGRARWSPGQAALGIWVPPTRRRLPGGFSLCQSLSSRHLISLESPSLTIEWKKHPPFPSYVMAPDFTLSVLINLQLMYLPLEARSLCAGPLPIGAVHSRHVGAWQKLTGAQNYLLKE